MDTAPDTEPAADDASSAEDVDAPSATGGDEVPAAPDTGADQAPADAAPADALDGPDTVTDDDVAASTVLAVGLPEAAEQRLLGSGRYDVVHDFVEADTADVVLLSTRLPRMEAQQALRTARRAPMSPSWRSSTRAASWSRPR